MADKSNISWTDATFNCIVGCTRVSSGCENCFAEKLSWRLQNNPKTPYYKGTVRKTSKGNILWTGQVNLVPEKLDQPIRWQRPRMIFTNSMSDLFHDEVPDDFLDAMFGVMLITPRHIYQNLTKRPGRMKGYISDRIKYPNNVKWRIDIANAWKKYGIYTEDRDVELTLNMTIQAKHEMGKLPQHIGLGVSCEDQATADERIPILASTPAQFRFLSLEPLLENINLDINKDKMHWVICGNESGHNARIGNINWLWNIHAQCKQLDIPVFVKQLGSNCIGEYIQPHPRKTYRIKTKDKKGADINEFPPGLRVQEFPSWMIP